MSNDHTDAGTMRPPISLFLICEILTGAGMVAVAYLPQSFALMAPLAAMICINVITRSRQRSRSGDTRSQPRAASEKGMGSLGPHDRCDHGKDGRDHIFWWLPPRTEVRLII